MKNNIFHNYFPKYHELKTKRKNKQPYLSDLFPDAGADPGYVKRGGRNPKGGAGWLI